MMLANTLVDTAKVMAKGQVTIPKDIREILGISSGDRITFIAENNVVRIVNSAVYAMQVLQNKMAGKAEHTDLNNEEYIIALVKDLRKENEKL